MCGRFAVGDTSGADWAEWLAIDPEPDWADGSWPAANWNVAPTQRVAFVVHHRGRRLAAAGRWGLIPHWWRKPLVEFKATTFNARSEEAAAKPMFRDAWAKRRCVIPALGYYEWSGKKGAKTPWFVTIRRNTPGIWFAGLWSNVQFGEEKLSTCTILTTAAGAATAHLHPRSPVILSDQDADTWMSGLGDAQTLMRAPDDALVDLWEVDAAVGKVQNNGPDLIARAGLTP